MRNLHQEITDRIVARLRAGVCPWRQPWSGKGHGIMPRNAVTGRAYSGVNVLFLWSRAQDNDYAIRAGSPSNKRSMPAATCARARRARRSSTFRRSSKKTRTATSARFRSSRRITVFNVSQCDNLPAKIVDPDAAARVINSRYA